MIAYSPKFSDLLEVLKVNEIIRKIIQGCKAKEARVSFLDYAISNKKVLFTGYQGYRGQKNNADLYESEYGRQTIRLASFFQKNLGLTENEARAAQELLVAKILEIADTTNIIKIVEGEDLRAAYLKKNYVPVTAGNNLASCMSHGHKQLGLDLYVFNPDTIKLVVNTINGKTAGRALLFTAFKSIAEANKGKNPLKVLGRIYAADTAARTRLNEWQQKNVDYLMNGGVPVGAGVSNLRLYVPLAVSEINSQPYLDNFTYIYKDKDQFYLTNHWLEASTWPRKPKGRPFDHPFDKKVVYSKNSNAWIPKKSATLYKGNWVKTSSLVTCPSCNNQIGKSSLVIHHQGGFICKTYCKAKAVGKDGKKLTYAKPEEVHGRCYGCTKYILKDKKFAVGFCGSCAKLYTKCAIANCRQQLFKSRAAQMDGQPVCPWHKNYGYPYNEYKYCVICKLLQRTVTKFPDHGTVCTSCARKIPKPQRQKVRGVKVSINL